MVTRQTRRRSAAAFTMLEIAIALAVIAFALVAVVGILPQGLTVERDTRDRTVINQEASYWMDAIKNSVQGADDLLQFVDQITINAQGSPMPFYNPVGADTPKFTSGRDIIGLLTHTGGVNVATVHALSGPATERANATRDLSFTYQLNVLVAPFTNGLYDVALTTNLWELALDFRWPALPGNQVGDNREVYRTLVSGSLTNDGNLFFFHR